MKCSSISFISTIMNLLIVPVGIEIVDIVYQNEIGTNTFNRTSRNWNNDYFLFSDNFEPAFNRTSRNWNIVMPRNFFFATPLLIVPVGIKGHWKFGFSLICWRKYDTILGWRNSFPSKITQNLDPDKKAAMVSNLLVVLCADEAAQPVLNTGSEHIRKQLPWEKPVSETFPFRKLYLASVPFFPT